jgi:hypothetical protein
MASTLVKDFFKTDIVSCNEIQNAGSALYLGAMPSCAEEAQVYTLELDTPVAIGDDTASLKVTVPSAVGTTVRLRQGSRVYFGADIDAATSFITVATETVVGLTPVTVPIEDATAVIAGATLGWSWGLLKLISPTNLPLNLTSNNTDRKDLSNGLRGSEVKVGIMFNPQISTIAVPGDRAYWEVVRKVVMTNNDIYALMLRNAPNGGEHAFGRAKVMELTNDGNINEISRPQFALNFQGEWNAPTLFPYLSTTEQNGINHLRKLAGLSVLTS